MQRRAALLALLACFGGLAHAQKADQAPPLAIKGYDAVSYFGDGGPVKGVASISYDFDDQRFLFSSAKNRDLFAANPERYAPQFHGLCAAGLADGRIVEPDPTAFVVRDGKLYLFQGDKGVQRVRQDPSLLNKAQETYRRR